MKNEKYKIVVTEYLSYKIKNNENFILCANDDYKPKDHEHYENPLFLKNNLYVVLKIEQNNLEDVFMIVDKNNRCLHLSLLEVIQNFKILKKNGLSDYVGIIKK